MAKTNLSSLQLDDATAKIIAGSTSLSLRDSGDANDNLILTDAGNATLRGDLTMSAGKRLIPDTGTATATAGAATLSKQSGTVTSEALTTAAGAAYTLTLTNTLVATTSRVFASVDNGTNSQGDPAVGLITPGSGSIVIKVANRHATQAFNGTIKINFFVLP
jgi:hypothetical protein